MICSCFVLMREVTFDQANRLLFHRVSRDMILKDPQSDLDGTGSLVWPTFTVVSLK